MLGGTIGAAAGLAGAAMSGAFSAFVAWYGVILAAAYAALSYVPLGVLVKDLFPPGKRGLMYAVLTNGTGAGFVLLAPIWIGLRGAVSWHGVYWVLAAVFCGLAAIAYALVPEADQQAGMPAVRERRRLTADLKAIVAERTFWVVSIPFLACGSSMAFVDVAMVAEMDSKGIDSAMVGVSVAALGFFEIAGAIAAGIFADRGAKRAVLVSAYAIRAGALVGLIFIPGLAGAMWFSVFFGVSYMGTVVASSLYLMTTFSGRLSGLALGLMWLIHQAGATAATALGGLSFDQTHAYDNSIAAVAALCALAAAVAFTTRGRRSPSLLPE
jgi:predicted MFS family arabinose efflux permease